MQNSSLKRIDAVVRPETFERVKKALEKASCPGMMVFTFHEHAPRQARATVTPGGRRFKASLLAKVLFTIVSKNRETQKFVDVILKAVAAGKLGDGDVFVSPVLTALRIRTGEKGTAAI